MHRGELQNNVAELMPPKCAVHLGQWPLLAVVQAETQKKIKINLMVEMATGINRRMGVRCFFTWYSKLKSG